MSRWEDVLSGKIVFVDVETTGLSDEDRVVTLAAIQLSAEYLPQGKFHLQICHLIFDPGRPSHPMAVNVHGYDDWTLRHQDAFADHADVLCELLSSANLVVAHNVAFDSRFINRELRLARKPEIETPFLCTMETYRQRFRGRRATLDVVAQQAGFGRSSSRHGALEDAWLAMMIFLWLHGCPHRFPFSSIPNPNPTNFRSVPARPQGPLPPRV